jgi:CheY-specific phosphatase CheX
MNDNPFARSVHKAVQSSIQSRIETFCKIQGVKTEVVEQLEHRRSFANMALILLSGEKVRLKLKLFFDKEGSSRFFENIHNPETNRHPAQNVDALKEVLNLVIGHLKILLEDVAVKCDISLPVAMRGYDDLFFPNSQKGATESIFRIEYKGSEIFLVSQLTCDDGVDLTEIVSYRDETSQIEFL